MRFLGLLFFFALIPVTSALAQAVPMETVAKQAIILDAETGQILFEKDADLRMPTSSMSKTMTMYMVFDALKNGRMTLDQQLPVSQKAWSMQGSKMFVAINSMVSVEDLIRGVIVQSGNDATIVLAEGLAGTEGDFAAAMTRKAIELGMNNSNFMNASGWPDENHFSTSRDLAILALALVRDHPEYYKYYGEKEFTYNGIKQGNRNPLLYRNIGADGIKTGHTEAAGYGLMASAIRDGRRVIMVLNGMASMDERAQESVRLMEWALNGFTNVDLFTQGEQLTEAKVAMGMAPSVPLIVDKNLKVTMPRMAAHGGIKRQAIYNGPLEAPIAKGQKVGIVRVTGPGMNPIEADLIASNEVPRLGFFPGLVEKAKRLIVGDRSLIAQHLE